MKKIVLLLLVVFVCGYVKASQTSFGNNTEIFDWLGVQIPDASDWVIRMYESVDANIEFAAGVPSDDDTWTGIEFAWNSAGAPGYCSWVIANTDSTYGLADGNYTYSVIFDSSNYATAARFAVIDDIISTVNYAGAGDFAYDPGGAIAGDWQAVPEPATFLLFGMGGFGAWLIRRNKRKA